MTPLNDNNGEPTLFSAVLTPHRSLSATGFVIVMTAVGSVSFTAGMVFLLMGAWPIFGFFGLDVLLIYLAFRANYRAGTAYEEVSVQRSALRVRKVSHRGGVSEWELNPAWVRLEREVHEEFGIEKLLLVSGGRKLLIAGFLSPDERKSFADALSAAIGQAKRGG
jgi:uncharacterized membrane protein